MSRREETNRMMEYERVAVRGEGVKLRGPKILDRVTAIPAMIVVGFYGLLRHPLRFLSQDRINVDFGSRAVFVDTFKWVKKGE